MTVDTRKIAGRRTLRFETFEQLMAEAERVASQPTRCLGNWTAAEILDHLARSIDESFAGSAQPAPWLARTFIAPFVKKSMLTKGLPAGFQLPEGMVKFQPRPSVSAADAIHGLRQATSRLSKESPSKPHPFFGTLTPEQWRLLHLRHAELHLSFVVPE